MMTVSTILAPLVPVFGLILLGVGCGRADVLGPRAFEVLNRFVITVTLPVLTFRTLARMDSADLARPTMILAVLGGAFLIYALAYSVERIAGRSLAEANIAGLASCFSNTGFIGLPVALLAFGPATVAPGAVAMALYASIIFGVAVLLSEMAIEGGGGVVAGIRRAGSALVRSPLIVLAILGMLWSIARLPLSGPLDTLLATLASATAPCALVAVGLFIALPRQSAAPRPIARVVLFKLIGHPLATAGLIQLLPKMPPPWDTTAILMAAMPSGSTSFVLAGRAGQWAMELSAWVILLTTSLAAVSLVVTLYLLH